MLDASLYEQNFEGAKWVMSPPLREKKDQAALWSGINQGVIQVVATDHCPFRWEQKLMGKDDFSKIPNGHPAIEHRMELLFSEGVAKGKISLSKFVEVNSTSGTVIIKPKKLVDPDDMLTLEEEVIVRRGEEQLRQGNYVNLEKLEHDLDCKARKSPIGNQFSFRCTGPK